MGRTPCEDADRMGRCFQKPRSTQDGWRPPGRGISITASGRRRPFPYRDLRLPDSTCLRFRQPVCGVLQLRPKDTSTKAPETAVGARSCSAATAPWASLTGATQTAPATPAKPAARSFPRTPWSRHPQSCTAPKSSLTALRQSWRYAVTSHDHLLGAKHCPRPEVTQ